RVGLKEQAPVAYAFLDVDAPVRDSRVLDRLGDVLLVVDRRADDLRAVGPGREKLRLGERLSLRFRRELLRRREHALEIENERIALRERPALPGYRLERLRHVEHLVALDQPQAVPVEAADLHLSLLQRRAVDPAPERDETPARSLRVEAEADMARK